MKKYKLGEIAKEVSSGATPSRSKLTYWENGNIPWLKTEQIGQYRIKNTNEHISQQAVKETALKLYPKNTISIAMYGEGRTRGNVSITDCELTTNQACCNIVVNNDIVEPFYLYYFLKTQYQNFRNLSSGIRKNLNTNIIKNYDIYLPSKEKQIKVSNFLKSIDDKIAINNQINELLERTAKAIYEYYFAQFDFPNKQGQPYKSSGGAMRFDPTLNRPIPKDFEVILLKEMCDIESGYPFSTDDYANNGKYKIITIKNVLNNYISSDTDNTIDFIPKNMPNYCSLKIGDILLSLTGNVGRVGIVFENNLLLNQRVGLLKLKNQNYRSFVYLTFLQQHFKQILKNIATGSNQKNLSPIETEKLPILFSQEAIKEFESITKPLLDKIINNHTENQKLKNLRDFLLPLLINAQVQI